MAGEVHGREFNREGMTFPHCLHQNSLDVPLQGRGGWHRRSNCNLHGRLDGVRRRFQLWFAAQTGKGSCALLAPFLLEVFQRFLRYSRGTVFAFGDWFEKLASAFPLLHSQYRNGQWLGKFVSQEFR